MMYLLLLGLVMLIAVVATLLTVRGDGGQVREPPRSRFIPPDLRPPSRNGGRGLDLQHWARGGR